MRRGDRGVMLFWFVSKFECPNPSSPYVLLVVFTVQEWEGRSQIAAAYNVGRSESGAAHNLLSHVDPDVCESLATMVQCLDLPGL